MTCDINAGFVSADGYVCSQQHAGCGPLRPDIQSILISERRRLGKVRATEFGLTGAGKDSTDSTPQVRVRALVL